jgi:DNA-binding NarL/FixJ family response regulator
MLDFVKVVPIRVALVDDDIGFQLALREAFAKTTDIALQWTVATKADGLRMLNKPQLDVLIVDLGLPDGSGVEIIDAAHAKWPECNLMVSTTFGDESHVMQSLEAGATGYLLKDGDTEYLTKEIRSIYRGGSPISPLIARKILRHFYGGRNRVDDQPLKEGDQRHTALSMREQEVLEYITKGFSSNEIAALMHLSPHTVLTFIRRIYLKLKVTSKAEAIYEARQQGLLE